ncbi:MAG: tryptophan-rich sensory protein [Clostridia bacterium]|nr:tryptophan-rich sensory protein [Clostridia bacterium]
MKKILKAIFIIAIPIIVGAVSGFLTRNNVYIYDVLIKPPFALPNYLFSVVWGVLYLTMGIALYLFINSNTNKSMIDDGVTLFAFQLLLNFFWSIIFFNLGMYFLAFLLLVALFIFVAITVATFYNTRKSSGILLIPYLLFLVYAGYLNFSIWYLNM